MNSFFEFAYTYNSYETGGPMKLIFLMTLSLASLSALAQFKNPNLANTGFVTIDTATQLCKVGTYVIQDITTITATPENPSPFIVPAWSKLGLQFCKEIGAIRTVGSAVTNASITGATRHAEDNNIANCALRGQGAAKGAVSCQSDYSGQ